MHMRSMSLSRYVSGCLNMFWNDEVLYFGPYVEMRLLILRMYLYVFYGHSSPWLALTVAKHAHAGLLGVEMDLQLGQMTLRSKHLTALEPEIANKNDIREVFGEQTMQVCVYV